MKTDYILYKNPVQLETLYVVQYLHFLGKDPVPKYCIERNHPSWVTRLPSISSDGYKYVGLERVIQFYENIFNVSNLLDKANKFKSEFPSYRIHT